MKYYLIVMVIGGIIGGKVDSPRISYGEFNSKEDAIEYSKGLYCHKERRCLLLKGKIIKDYNYVDGSVWGK